MCTIKDYDYNILTLCNNHRQMVKTDLEIWQKCYLPNNIQKGTILDIGAGCGETVQFYLKHGAQSVIAIEQDEKCTENLRSNFKNNHRVSILNADISHIKSDIEGAEFGAIFEIHYPFHWKRVEKTHMRNVGIYRLEENWGNIIKRTARKYAER